MKVIDLLNKIANGEEVPNKLKIGEWEYDKEDEDLEYETINRLADEDFTLNDEVEVIEEDKKIEKIDVNHLQTVKKCNRAKILGKKINEIIDKEELYNFLNNATEEDKLRNELGSLEKGINSAMLDTCEVYGLSGNCGKQCPKYQDKTCECWEEIK